jgi:RNA polymerase sigma factor for flagellar operon FliA
MREIEQATSDLAHHLGHWPSVKELALKTGFSIADVRTLQGQRGIQVHSLEHSTSSRDEDYEWQIEDTDEAIDPACVADRKAVSMSLAAAMKSLEHRERQILHMRYNQGLPLRAIGDRLKISESRVSQIHHRTLSRLRAHLRAHDVA